MFGTPEKSFVEKSFSCRIWARAPFTSLVNHSNKYTMRQRNIAEENWKKKEQKFTFCTKYAIHCLHLTQTFRTLFDYLCEEKEKHNKPFTLQAKREKTSDTNLLLTAWLSFIVTASSFCFDEFDDCERSGLIFWAIFDWMRFYC